MALRLAFRNMINLPKFKYMIQISKHQVMIYVIYDNLSHSSTGNRSSKEAISKSLCTYTTISIIYFRNQIILRQTVGSECLCFQSCNFSYLEAEVDSSSSHWRMWRTLRRKMEADCFTSLRRRRTAAVTPTTVTMKLVSAIVPLLANERSNPN